MDFKASDFQYLLLAVTDLSKTHDIEEVVEVVRREARELTQAAGGNLCPAGPR